MVNAVIMIIVIIIHVHLPLGARLEPIRIQHRLRCTVLTTISIVFLSIFGLQLAKQLNLRKDTVRVIITDVYYIVDSVIHIISNNIMQNTKKILLKYHNNSFNIKLKL